MLGYYPRNRGLIPLGSAVFQLVEKTSAMAQNLFYQLIFFLIFLLFSVKCEMAPKQIGGQKGWFTMDHSEPKDEEYSHQQCAHGMCLNHDPEWENLGQQRREPQRNMFGRIKTYWEFKCCRQKMVHAREVQTQRCRKCGRTREHILNYNVVLCLCCGHHFTRRLPHK
jgi:hypothetical protein